MQRWIDLGDTEIVMPVEIFSLAREFADHPDRGIVSEILQDGYDTHDKPFQRRVFFTFLRFAGDGYVAIDDVERYLIDGLRSNNHWVAYDAAWASMHFINDSIELEEELERIAQSAPQPDPGAELSSSDSTAHFHKKVREVLASTHGEE